MSVGEYIKNKRLEKGLSQRQLSVVCGISNSEISRIEAGERQNPSPAVLRPIAAALGVPYEEILSAAGYLPSGTEAGSSPGGGLDTARFPDWVYNLPPDLYDFVREDASNGWAYLRMAKGFSRKDLAPGELEALVRTWIQAKRGYGKGPEYGKGPGHEKGPGRKN